MSKDAQIAAELQAIKNNMNRYIIGDDREPGTPIDIIGNAVAASDLMEVPLDTMEHTLFDLYQLCKDKPNIPASIVRYYTTQLHSFTAISSAYHHYLASELKKVKDMCDKCKGAKG